MTDDAKNIFLYQGTNQYGPFAESEVSDGIRNGQVTRDAFVWDPLVANWIKITDVLKFSIIFGESGNAVKAALPGKPNLGTLIDFSTEKIEGRRTRFIRMKKMLSITYCIVDPKTKQPVSDPRETMTMNVSGSGLAFKETDAPITPGVTVDIKIKFPKIAHPFRIFGEVVRIMEIPGSDSFEIGIRFIDISETMQQHLLYYLQTLLTDTQAAGPSK